MSAASVRIYRIWNLG